MVSLEGSLHRAVLVPLVLAIVVFVVIAIVLPDNARSSSLSQSKATLLSANLAETQTRLSGLAQEINAQLVDVMEMAVMAANYTDRQLPVQKYFSQLYWARTNTENNAVPPVDGAGLSMFGAHFQYNMTSYSQLYHLPYANQSALAVTIFRPILRSRPAITQLYIGFADDLIFWSVFTPPIILTDDLFVVCL
jgi:hypothetical protein